MNKQRTWPTLLYIKAAIILLHNFILHSPTLTTMDEFRKFSNHILRKVSQNSILKLIGLADKGKQFIGFNSKYWKQHCLYCSKSPENEIIVEA